MVDTNKILTVSYGTFSCTLEGFDDSFGTMKAIAEYFRDLAADDRYFGAEPPTPDAEMLARIAEKEISRRVEAHLDKNNIVLRAGTGAALPPVVPDDIADNGIEDAAPEQAAPEPALRVRPSIEADASETGAESEVPGDVADDIADQMAPLAEKIADAVAQDINETAPAPDQPLPDTAAGDAAIADLTAEITAPAPATPTTAAPRPAPLDDTSDIVAKLRRIRAVVSQDRDTGADPLYSEDEHADDFLADTHDDIEAALAIDDAAEQEDNAPTATDDDDLSALLDRFGVDPAGDIAEDDESEADDDALFLPDSLEDEEDDEEDTAQEAVAPTDTPDLTDDPHADAPAPVRARILKMKRTDFEAAIATGGLEDATPPQDETGLSEEEEDELLRELAAVEAELQASDPIEHAIETAEVADDDDDDAFAFEIDDGFDDEEDIASHFGDEDEAAAAGHDNIFGAQEDATAPGPDAEISPDARRAPFGDEDENEMGRIFAQTDSQMDEEVGKGRRNAIAHLRAAVAATKAEEAGGGSLKDEGPDPKAYRDDLANVVRPRRPEAGKPQTRRPETARPAPLKLVAEQRVDLNRVSPAHPVRPRRVSVAPATLPDGATPGGDFAEYAESVGAGSLPELLEAAAAYLSFVEGREQFSRPQLMTHVRQVEKDDFSREDGLRSFGQLLREGKIEKISGGRFKASETISYRPDTRYAGE